MDDGQNNTLVFRSDDIATAHSSRKDNYFVNVTKNPLLRWLLRTKKVEEEKPEEPEKPVIKVPEKPKPQFRATIRISTLKLETEQKKYKNTITIFSIIAIILIIAVVFLAIYR